jgi:hypothetical protein
MSATPAEICRKALAAAETAPLQQQAKVRFETAKTNNKEHIIW